VNREAPAAPAELDAQELTNARAYARPDVVDYYVREQDDRLFAAEAVALILHRDAIAGRRVLELGPGTGRVTSYLALLAAELVAIDRSGEMVAICRRNVPSADLRTGDMRDLSAFPDASFDAAMLSGNLIDVVGHEDRLRVLGELGRILVPEGLLVMSSHNRSYPRERPSLGRSRNPLTQLIMLYTYIGERRSRRRLRPYERETTEYAIVNDSAHDYRLLHYPIDRREQARQLAGAGLDLVEVLDQHGRSVAGEVEDTSSPSLTYIARRRG
jgi:SAM-dependent methyltransferase